MALNASPLKLLPRARFAAPHASVAAAPLPALDFAAAAKRLEGVAQHTPLQLSRGLSRRFGADIYLKREDLQVVRSYKLRGAYNLMSQLPAASQVVCASAGNHAQGFAYSAQALGHRGVVFMPLSTPRQKQTQVKMWGADAVEVRLVGDTFDDAAAEARRFCDASPGMVYVPPFDDARIIEGQGTVAREVLADLPDPDFVFVPIGGGGLAAGCGALLKAVRPACQLVGLEPEGAPSMLQALLAGRPVRLPAIDTFVDGAAVRRVGDLTFPFVRATLDAMALVPEGRVCTTTLQLYNSEALVVEPAGALAVAALDDFSEAIRGRKVVCIVSGSNADVDRMAEIKERAMTYEGLKRYFLVKFAQRPGALREFVTFVLPAGADIVRFEYLRANYRESGPALVGLELAVRADYDVLLANMRAYGVDATEIRRDGTSSGGDTLAQFLI